MLAGGVLVLLLTLAPAPSVVETPVPEGGSCLSVGLEGSVTEAGDPLNPDDKRGTLDAGSLSCSGLPRDC